MEFVPHALALPISPAFADDMGWNHDESHAIHEIALAIVARGNAFTLRMWDKHVCHDRSPSSNLMGTTLCELRERIARAECTHDMFIPLYFVGALNFSSLDFKLRQ